MELNTGNRNYTAQLLGGPNDGQLINSGQRTVAMCPSFELLTYTVLNNTAYWLTERQLANLLTA